MKAHLYLGATEAQIDSIADQYSEDPAQVRRFSQSDLFTPRPDPESSQGSPFDTGDLNVLT